MNLDNARKELAKYSKKYEKLMGMYKDFIESGATSDEKKLFNHQYYMLVQTGKVVGGILKLTKEVSAEIKDYQNDKKANAIVDNILEEASYYIEMKEEVESSRDIDLFMLSVLMNASQNTIPKMQESMAELIEHASEFAVEEESESE